MENIDLTTIIVSLGTVLFSAGAWSFYEKRMKLKSQESAEEKNEQNMYRDDLKNRVRRLEELLEASTKKEAALQKQVLILTEEVSSLRTKVEFLEKENERLKNI